MESPLIALRPIPNSWCCPICYEDFDNEDECQGCIDHHPTCEWCEERFDVEQSPAQDNEIFCSEKCEQECERNMRSHESN